MGSHRAAIYCRISKDTEGTALGVERQETLCRELAERKGWTVADVYVDNDLGAYAGKLRPSYEAMLGAIRDRCIDAVVCVDQDRLTRHTRELEDFITLADEHGVALANVSGDLDLSTSDGRFRARIMGAVARQESEKKSERLRRQRDQAAAKGLPVNGARTFGYKLGGMEVDPEEAALLRDAAKRALAGESLANIAREWNDRGIPLVKGGTGWSVRRIAELLVAPRQAGLRVHRGEVVGEAAWPAVLDRDTHERLLALARTRKGRGERVKTLLSGMLVCEACGQPMMANRTSKAEGARRKYVCRRTPERPDACGGISIVAEPTEEWIAEAVLHRLSSGALATAVEQAASDDDEVAGAAQALTAAEAHLDELAAMFGAGELSKAEWLTAREAAQDRVRAARAVVERVSGADPLTGLPADAEGLAAWWHDEETPDSKRRALVHAVLAAVAVGPMPSTGPRRFRPERLTPTWKV